MKPNSVQLHRVIRSTADKVYRAFLNADAMARWWPPYGHLCTVHHLEPRVGGTFKMSFVSFATGHSQSFAGKYLELTPGKSIRFTTIFDNPGLPGEMLVHAQIAEVSCGVSLQIEQSNIPSVIPSELCYLGWQEGIAQLTNLVESNA